MNRIRRLRWLITEELTRCGARYPGCCGRSHRCYHNRFHAGNHHAAWCPLEGWR